MDQSEPPAVRARRSDRTRQDQRTSAVMLVLAIVGLLLLVGAGVALAVLFGTDEPLGEPDSPTGSPGADVPGSRLAAIAFVPYWDQEQGFEEVEAFGEHLGTVSPWWYAPTADGEVVEQHEEFTDIDLERVETLQADGFQVMPSIANHQGGSWDFEVVGEILADEDALARHVDALTDLVLDNGFDGLQLDYENLDEDDAEAYADLVRRLAEAFEAHDKTLAVAVHGKVQDETDGWGAGHDYALLGEHAHEVHVMAYDLHHTSSDPGPSAPLWWVNEVLRFAAQEIPAERLVLGIGLYGYDWGQGDRAEGVTLAEAEARLRRFDGELEYDIRSQTPVFRYTDGDESRILWFEDARSIARKLELIDDHGLGGVFFWRMGGTTPEVWEAVEEQLGDRVGPGGRP